MAIRLVTSHILCAFPSVLLRCQTASPSSPPVLNLHKPSLSAHILQYLIDRNVKCNDCTVSQGTSHSCIPLNSPLFLPHRTRLHWRKQISASIWAASPEAEAGPGEQERQHGAHSQQQSMQIYATVRRCFNSNNKHPVTDDSFTALSYVSASSKPASRGGWCSSKLPTPG